jgi:type IV pilus assembly protein PilE
MRQTFVSHTAAPMNQRRLSNGFTLIEVMIVVAIVTILAAVAIPSYRDYILRGQLVDGTTILSTVRADMERYYQDNRRYTNVGAFVAPCASVDPRTRTQGNFVVTCAGADLADNTFKLTATGSNAAMGFAYTIDNRDARTTASVGSSWSMPTPNTCWAVKRGQVCN